jgi:biotin carboxyl carrier protein
VLEAMKMEHTITSPHDGTVTGLAVSQGEQVERGAVLAEVQPPEEEGPS